MNTIKLAAPFIVSCMIAVGCTKEKALETFKPAVPAPVPFDTAALIGTWHMDSCNYVTRPVYYNNNENIGRLGTLEINPDHTYYIKGTFFYGYYTSTEVGNTSAAIGLKTESGNWSIQNRVLYLKAISVCLFPSKCTFNLLYDTGRSYNLGLQGGPVLYDTSSFGNYLIDNIAPAILNITPVNKQIYATTIYSCYADMDWINASEVQCHYYMVK